MRVGIVAQKGNAHAAYLAAQLRETVRDEGGTTVVDAATAAEIDAEGVDVEAMAECDLVVSIGGDGTFLYAARGAGSTPIIGVNLGEVGFLNAVAPGEAAATLREELAAFRERGEVRAREAPRLEAEGTGDWSVHPALNEIVVVGPQRGHGQGIDYEVRVDGELYTGGHADGVLVSTPTGSSAYNLSEGGPLVHPDVDGLVVTEMCAQASMPPLVVGTDREVEIRVMDAPHAVVSSDSTRKRVEIPETVTVSAADDPVRIAGPSSDFFQALGKLD